MVRSCVAASVLLLQNVFSYYKMCSLTLGACMVRSCVAASVLLLENVMCSLTIACVLLH